MNTYKVSFSMLPESIRDKIAIIYTDGERITPEKFKSFYMDSENVDWVSIIHKLCSSGKLVISDDEEIIIFSYLFSDEQRSKT